MSGPKVIDYRVVERERAEVARRRQILRGRADALAQRSRQAGELVLANAARELSQRQFRARTQQAMAGGTAPGLVDT